MPSLITFTFHHDPSLLWFMTTGEISTRSTVAKFNHNSSSSLELTVIHEAPPDTTCSVMTKMKTITSTHEHTIKEEKETKKKFYDKHVQETLSIIHIFLYFRILLYILYYYLYYYYLLFTYSFLFIQAISYI